jgi:hypothetical protein
MTRRRPMATAIIALATAIVVAMFGASSALAKGFFGTSGSTVMTSRDFSMMHDAGVASLRFALQWPATQASAGHCLPTAYNPPVNQCNWANTDSVVAGLAYEHITPLVDLGGTPAWANHRSGFYATRYTPLETKTGQKGWKAFVSAAAKRYGPGGVFWKTYPTLPNNPVRIWQVWNEQNWFNAFRPNPTGKGFAPLLKLTSKTIRAQDKGATIMLGGMYGTPGAQGVKATDAWDFLSQLYKAHAGSAFDAVALHPYSQTVAGINFQAKKLHDVLKQEGDTKKQLWVTELGWGSDAAHVQNRLVFSPAKQKKLLTQSFKLLLKKRHQYNIGGVIWYSWRDPTPNEHTCTFCLSSGLLKNDYTPKPAYNAFKKFAPGP